MISLDLQNLFRISSPHGVTKKEWDNFAKQIPEFLKKVLERKQGFYEILDDENILRDIENFCKKAKGKYTDIVVLGIGGSALGALALRDALQTSTMPKLHVLDNIDPEVLTCHAKILPLAKTLFLIITKSGETPETMAQYFFFRKKIEEKKLPVKDHFVFVTDPKKGFLRSIAQKENILSFSLPENVGGRFSVLTAVGLLPACLIGIDIRGLIKGAKIMRAKFLSENFEKNLPFQLAVAQFIVAQKGKTQHVFMPYANALRSFSRWFTQLLAESTGKINARGQQVGITPLPSVGVTDQHSLLQLFVQGPNDKLTIFVTVEKCESDPLIPVPKEKSSWEFLKNVSFGKLRSAEQRATADSLTEEHRPNLTIALPILSPEHLGELFFFLEGATAFLGEFLKINAFDQPGVERSKTLTRKYLSSRK